MENTANKIADYIALKRGDWNNKMLKDSIKYTIYNWRATMIRQEINKFGNPRLFAQHFLIPLVKVDTIDNCLVTLGCTILRTVNKVPRAIRINDSIPFLFIGTPDFSKPFGWCPVEDFKVTTTRKYGGATTVKVDYRNEYLYILNAKRLKHVGIIEVLEDPSSINQYCAASSCYDDDSIFPMPQDMIQRMILAILDGEIKLMSPTAEVTTDEQVQ